MEADKLRMSSKDWKQRNHNTATVTFDRELKTVIVHDIKKYAENRDRIEKSLKLRPHLSSIRALP